MILKSNSAMGSVAALFLIPADAISNGPVIINLTVFNEITLNQGSLDSFYFTPENCNYSVTENENENAFTYTHRITGKYPAYSRDNNITANAMRYNSYLIIAQNSSGELFLIGTQKTPAYFSTDYATGNTPEEFNGNDFSFRCESKMPIVEYLPLPSFVINAQGELVATDGGNPVFDVEISADGNLVLTINDPENYSLNASGEILYTL